MTAKELYAADADFRALMADWVATRWAPYPLGDFLEERGLPDAADFARWAYEQPERHTINVRGVSRTFPSRWGDDTEYTMICYGPLQSAHQLPTGALSGTPTFQDGETPLEVLLAVMDRWAPEGRR